MPAQPAVSRALLRDRPAPPGARRSGFERLDLLLVLAFRRRRGRRFRIGQDDLLVLVEIHRHLAALHQLPEEQLHEKKVETIFSDELRRHLARAGFDPLMGARPMQRLIQDTIRKALADELLFGKLMKGGKVQVDLDDNEQVVLTYSESSSPPPPEGEDEEQVETLES